MIKCYTIIIIAILASYAAPPCTWLGISESSGCIWPCGPQHAWLWLCLHWVCQHRGGMCGMWTEIKWNLPWKLGGLDQGSSKAKKALNGRRFGCALRSGFWSDTFILLRLIPIYIECIFASFLLLKVFGASRYVICASLTGLLNTFATLEMVWKCRLQTCHCQPRANVVEAECEPKRAWAWMPQINTECSTTWYDYDIDDIV